VTGEKLPQATSTSGVLPGCSNRRFSLSWGKEYSSGVLIVAVVALGSCGGSCLLIIAYLPARRRGSLAILDEDEPIVGQGESDGSTTILTIKIDAESSMMGQVSGGGESGRVSNEIGEQQQKPRKDASECDRNGCEEEGF
jgi:hypothetical protein